VTTTLSRPTVFAYDPGEFWDEMFVSADEVRPYYASLASVLSTLSHAEVERRQRAADLSFQARGITFAVNQGPEGVEKIMPFDLVPRIITAEEWRKIERGLDQRVRALNLFLHDIYHTGAILRQNVVRSAAWTSHWVCIRMSLAATWCAIKRASSTCSRTTCGLRRACRTSSRTGGCSSGYGRRSFT